MGSKQDAAAMSQQIWMTTTNGAESHAVDAEEYGAGCEPSAVDRTAIHRFRT